jgi:hypothetical protein
MPYRRLPNTDNARLNAMKAAFQKGKDLPPFKLAYSQSTFTKLQSFMPYFERAMIEYKQAYLNQVKKSKDYVNALRKVKLYISHFVQVMNMTIARGEQPASIRTFYGMTDDDKRIPGLNTEAEVIKWGECLIKGEQERTRKGQSPITNPTIALVRVRYEDFMDAYNQQKTLQKTNVRSLKELAQLRSDADNIILAVWNEVEETYKDLPDELRREKALEYGISYVYRKNEIKQLNLFDAVGVSLSQIQL